MFLNMPLKGYGKFDSENQAKLSKTKGKKSVDIQGNSKQSFPEYKAIRELGAIKKRDINCKF